MEGTASGAFTTPPTAGNPGEASLCKCVCNLPCWARASCRGAGNRMWYSSEITLP